jgi:hypothetical protein
VHSSLFAVGRLSIVALLASAGGISLVVACSSSSSPPPSTDAGGDLDASDATTDGEIDALPGDASNTCDHASTTTYSCEPLPLSEGACMGGPMQAGDAGAGFSYSIGCVATVPACSAFYPGEVVTCTCNPLGMTGSWTCGA